MKYEGKAEGNNLKKIVQISLMKKTESFTFVDPINDNNMKVISILQVKVHFLGFYETFKGFKLIGKGSFAQVIVIQIFFLMVSGFLWIFYH